MSIAPQKWVSNLANQANAHTHTRHFDLLKVNVVQI